MLGSRWKYGIMILHSKSPLHFHSKKSVLLIEPNGRINIDSQLDCYVFSTRLFETALVLMAQVKFDVVVILDLDRDLTIEFLRSCGYFFSVSPLSTETVIFLNSNASEAGDLIIKVVETNLRRYQVA